MTQNTLNIFMLSPRGFCAGVERAVHVVENALTNFKSPIYVKHQIVHNRNIIEDFESRGVVFINDLSDVPDNSVLIFNAHGVTKEFEEAVKSRNITYVDATCPLVKKVHKEAIKYENDRKQILIIGHKEHPEVIATKSRITRKSTVIEDTKDAIAFTPDPKEDYAFVTQTTLSVDYIAEIVDILVKKIPSLIYSTNICYATQNRQTAIKEVIQKIDGLIIVGSESSSNSNRLKEIGDANNVKSYLIDNPRNIPFNDLESMKSIAISAGASSPDYIIKDVLETITNKFNTKIIPLEVLKENVKFLLPKVSNSK